MDIYFHYTGKISMSAMAEPCGRLCLTFKQNAQLFSQLVLLNIPTASI